MHVAVSVGWDWNTTVIYIYIYMHVSIYIHVRINIYMNVYIYIYQYIQYILVNYREAAQVCDAAGTLLLHVFLVSNLQIQCSWVLQILTCYPYFFNVKSFFCGLHYRAQNRGRRDCTPPCRTGPGLEASLGRKKEAESEHVFVENLDLQILTQSCHYMFGVRMSGCGARNVRMRQRGCWTACGTCGFVLFGLVLSSDIVIPV